MSYSADLISRLVINMSILDKKPMSNTKLVRVLYYIQAAFLVKKNKKAFNDSIEAWKYGPCIPNIYKKYRSAGTSRIENWQSIEDYEVLDITEADLELIKFVVNSYCNTNRFQIIKKVSLEDPFVDTYTEKYDKVIQNTDIKDYYSSKPDLIFGDF